MKRLRAIFGFWLALCLCLSPLAAAEGGGASYTAADYRSAAEDILRWKKAENSAGGELLSGSLLAKAGTTAADWYAIGLGRWGFADDYEAYRAMLEQAVSSRYAESGGLSPVKATKWHRIILALLAAGGDPTAAAREGEGKTIDLVADGTYNRGKTASLGRQGLNGWIWALIALDAMRYPVPDGAYNTREDMIGEILRRQLADGGFALTGQEADPDMTAMAVQALAPYCDDEKGITFTELEGRETVKTVKTAVDEALSCLSALQEDTGDYASWGTRNVESTAQVAIALCCLGIDPLTDSRFIKNGRTVVDGVMLYRQADGGFAHSYTADPENPDAQPGVSNSMAGEQVLCALNALWRQREGLRTLYDFLPEAGEGGEVSAAFTDADRETIRELDGKANTDDYPTVVALLDKLSRTADFEGKEDCLALLRNLKDRIDGIQREIDDINASVLVRLYPFEQLSLGDKPLLDGLIRRHDALDAADQRKIDRWEDVLRAKAQVDSQWRALLIGATLTLLGAMCLLLLIRRVRRRRGQKWRAMEELAARCEDEE